MEKRQYTEYAFWTDSVLLLQINCKHDFKSYHFNVSLRTLFQTRLS